MGWREQSEPIGVSAEDNDDLLKALRDRLRQAGGYIKSEVEGLPSQLPRQLGLAARSAVTGVTALPGMAADAAMSGYNYLTGSNEQMPTQATQNLMTQIGLPEPQGTVENVNQFLGSAITGAKIPMPSISRPAPANFQPDLTRQQRTFDVGQREGYVVPPATIKPNIRNIALESIGGKQATEQTARATNQQVTNKLANRTLGLPETREITRDTLEQVRDEAGQVYEMVKSAGRIATDDDYKASLQGIRANIEKIREDFPKANVAASKEIKDLVDSLDVPEFDTNSGMEYLKQLRNEAADNLASLDEPTRKALGRAQREAAEALEEMIFRQLKNAGQGDLAQRFDNARRQIAKSYTVQAALDEGSGSVDAMKLAQILNKGKPLSPELELAARMGGSFPRAMIKPEKTGSVGSNALDFGLTVGGATFFPMAQIPAWAALGIIPAKYGTRRLALSNALQRQLLGEQFTLPPKVVGGAAGAAAGAYGAGQE
jgi:spore coat protein CotF